MMYCIGITGSIGSGKSSVCDLFVKHNVPVISADAFARALTEPNQPAYAIIVNHFGPDILLNDGALNRRALRDIIFRDQHARHWLEQLLHPLIRKSIEESVSQLENDYCMIEIPLLKNREDYPFLSRVLVVTAPLDQRVKRIMARDRCTESQALSIIATQPSDENYQRLANDIILNNGSMENLKKQVDQLHQQYLNL